MGHVREWLLISVGVTLSLALLMSHPLAAETPAAAARSALEEVVKSEAHRVFKAKNDEGVKNRRATHSKKFLPAGDGRWQVSFTQDIAEPERMRTERYLLTIERDDRGKWGITDRELQQTYEKLIRDIPGNEKFFRFERFEVSREGMELSATDGTLVVDHLLGEPESFRLYADELSYDYSIPTDVLGNQRHLFPHLKREHPETFALVPYLAEIGCDPATCTKLLETAFSGLEEIGEAELDEPLAKQHRKSIERHEKRLREVPFFGFRRPREPGRRTLRLQVEDKRDNHWVRLSYDSESAREVSFAASGFGRLFSYPSAQSRSDFSVADIERRDDLNARDYELRKLKGSVELAVDQAELVRGNIEFTLRAKRDLDEIVFSLRDLTGAAGRRSSNRNPSLTVNSLQNGKGEDLTWVRLGTSSGLVVFPETVRRDEEFVLRMEFENEGSILKLTPTYSYMDRSGWLPFVRYTDRIEDFELDVTTPARYETLCVGAKIDEKVENGLRTARCAGREVHFPTVIFGIYYDLEPRITATKIDGTKIPVKVHVDKDSMTSWNIRGKQLRPLGQQAVNSLNLYREIYGVDYPYPKLDLVNAGGGIGAQSPASMVYVGSPAFRGAGVLGTAAEFVRSLVAHEVAHQWWGSAIGTANIRNYWFVESLAEYSSALFIESVVSAQKGPAKGHRAYLDHVADWRHQILESDLLTSVKDARVLYAGSGGYYAAVYNKGPYVFHMLRVTVGDARFYAFLRNLGQQLAGREIVTSDIEDVASETFGTDLKWFFDQWIRGIGMPEYFFEYETRQVETGDWIVSGVVRQRVVAGREKYELEDVYYEGLVSITVLGRDKQEYPARIVVQGPETPFQFKVPIKPVTVTLNKYGEMLAHDVVALPW